MGYTLNTLPVVGQRLQTANYVELFRQCVGWDPEQLSIKGYELVNESLQRFISEGIFDPNPSEAPIQGLLDIFANVPESGWSAKYASQRKIPKDTVRARSLLDNRWGIATARCRVAVALQGLIRQGVSKTEIARALGVSPSLITLMLRLRRSITRGDICQKLGDLTGTDPAAYFVTARGGFRKANDIRDEVETFSRRPEIRSMLKMMLKLDDRDVASVRNLVTFLNRSDKNS
jgi:hypothetical protein